MSQSPERLACLGECMIELRHQSEAQLTLGFGGDSLNTAVYLARLCDPTRHQVAYLTALGDDPYSQHMQDQWHTEGVDISHVVTLADALPGLYAIQTDAAGERRFYYWRQQAAARRFIESHSDAALAALLAGFKWLYFSGITLSIYDSNSRDRLANALGHARAQGTKIAFDGNYRPASWRDGAEAQAVFRRFAALVDIALPSFDDEQALWRHKSVEATLDAWRAAGVREIVVKRSSEGYSLADANGIRHVSVSPAAHVIDTTAAGDSFNAGYLAARLAGKSMADAAEQGHRLAACVIGHPGAIIDRSAMPG